MGRQTRRGRRGVRSLRRPSQSPIARNNLSSLKTRFPFPPRMATSSRAPVRDERIKVCIRLRPFTRTEKLQAGGKAAWTWHEKTMYQQIFPAQIPAGVASTNGDATKRRRGGSTVASRAAARRDAASSLPSSYTLDYLYPPASQTQSIYHEMVKDVILAAMDGVHSSVLLYGETGTGKTYTMQGGRTDPGLLQLSAHDIFNHVACHPNLEFLLRLSYVEIYNEQVHDLLAAGATVETKIDDVPARESREAGRTNNGVLRGVREEIVVSTAHLLSLVHVGNLHRHVATPASNAPSSQSHVVFRLVVESQVAHGSRDGTERVPGRSATLHLIDLAGSETVPVATTTTTGPTCKEGTVVNRSLLTLGHIIWKLSRDRHRTLSSTGTRNVSTLVHLPYRNSKLTRLLEPSLGGQAQLAIVCTASPSVTCLAETHKTLTFATRARRVCLGHVLHPVPQSDASLLGKYRARICALKEQLAQLQRPNSVVPWRPSHLSARRARQRVLQGTIHTMHRVILNSSPVPQEERPHDDDARPAWPHETGNLKATRAQYGPLPHAQDQAAVERPVERYRQSGARHAVPGSNEGHCTDAGQTRPRLPDAGSAKCTTLRTTRETLRLSASSFQDTRDDLTETKEEEEALERPEVNAEVQRGPLGARGPLSLLARLKDKYSHALNTMAPRSGQSDQCTEQGDVVYQTTRLLRDFVRGLESAQAALETRMSRMQALERENRRLRQALASGQAELWRRTTAPDAPSASWHKRTVRNSEHA